MKIGRNLRFQFGIRANENLFSFGNSSSNSKEEFPAHPLLNEAWIAIQINSGELLSSSKETLIELWERKKMSFV